jgi:hypothetical protein
LCRRQALHFNHEPSFLVGTAILRARKCDCAKRGGCRAHEQQRIENVFRDAGGTTVSYGVKTVGGCSISTREAVRSGSIGSLQQRPMQHGESHRYFRRWPPVAASLKQQELKT